MLVAFYASPSHSKPVAILINFDPHGTQYERAMQEGIRVFRDDLGYDVKYIRPTEDIGTQMKTVLATIEKPDDLVIETIGHGTVHTSNADPRRFPKLKNRSEGPYLSAPDHFIFENGSSIDNPVGTGDFVEAIRQLRAQNPTVPIKVIMQQCYSGHAARTLNQLEGVQAYSAASDKEESQAVGHGQVMWVDFLNRNLTVTAKSQQAINFADLFRKSREERMNDAIAHSTDPSVDVPWSPLDVQINNWCVANEHKRTSKAKATPNSRVLEQIKSYAMETVKWESRVQAHLHQAYKCADIHLLTRKKQTIQLAQQSYLKSLDILIFKLSKFDYASFQKGRRLVLESSLSNQFKDIVLIGSEVDFAAWKRNKIKTFESLKRECSSKDFDCDGKIFLLRGLSTLFIESPDYFGEYSPLECDEKGTFEKCVGLYVKSAKEVPAMALESLAMLKNNLSLPLKHCSKNRADFYSKCYERYWNEASASELDSLSKKWNEMNRPIEIRRSNAFGPSTETAK